MSELDYNQCRLHKKNFVSICVDTCTCEDINIVQSFGIILGMTEEPDHACLNGLWLTSPLNL